jgi:hypothetical protein
VGVDPNNKETGYYQDYDHFSVYNRPDDETAQLVRDYAGQFQQAARACELAEHSGVTGPSTPFISATKKSGPAVAGLPRDPAPSLALSGLE